MKPQYHFTAPCHWINDPNGLIYYKGYYHIFYQHFPYACHWGTMHWGHAITKDFITYQHLPIALYPSKDYDRNGCFSGSAIEVDGKMYLYYTAVRYLQENPDYYHIRTGKEDACASQAMLVSDDGLTFDNQHNKKQIIPVIKEAYRGDVYDTRDPKVWKKKDGKYAMIVGTKKPLENDYCGKVLFYESDDAKHFYYKNSYHAEIGTMWECPDLFQIDDQYVMIFSPENIDMPPKPCSNAQYMFIDFDENALMIKDHSAPQYLDYGLDFYAPQTFLSKDQKRYMLAWLRMRVPAEGENWVGMMIMPRELSCHDGCLYQRVLPQIDELFTLPGEIDFVQPFKLVASLQKNSVMNLGGFNIEIKDDCLHVNREAVSIQAEKVCNDVYSPVLNGKYDIVLYYDHHVFEIFINDGRYVMSQLVYTLNDSIEIKNTEVQVYVSKL